MSKSCQKAAKIFLLLTLATVTYSMMLQKQKTHFKSQDDSFHSDTRFNFLKRFLNKRKPTHNWRPIGSNPTHDIKLKKIISASVSSALLHQYILFNDKKRSIRLIYGEMKTEHKRGQDILKLVFVIQNSGRNEGYYGVEVRARHCDYSAGIDRLQVTRYGQSYRCQDVLSLLGLSQNAFRRGPNLDFMNGRVSDRRLLHRVGAKIRHFACKSMDQLVKEHMGEFNLMIAKVLGSSYNGSHGQLEELPENGHSKDKLHALPRKNHEKGRKKIIKSFVFTIVLFNLSKFEGFKIFE